MLVRAAIESAAMMWRSTRRGKLGKAASEEDEPAALTAPLDQGEPHRQLRRGLVPQVSAFDRAEHARLNEPGRKLFAAVDRGIGAEHLGEP